MHSSRLSLVCQKGNEEAGKSLLGHRQTKRQTGGVAICMRFEMTEEKVRGAEREICQTQTDCSRGWK